MLFVTLLKTLKTYTGYAFVFCFLYGCGAEPVQKETLIAGKDSLERAPVEEADSTAPEEPLMLKVSFQEEDVPVNEYLVRELKPLRDNFKRINSITEWSAVKTWSRQKPSKEYAEYYVKDGTIEKIIVRDTVPGTRLLTEYYLLGGKLSMVIEKTLQTPEIVLDHFYFLDGTLVHAINSQDCGSPFSEDYLRAAQKGIMKEFKNLMKQFNP